MSKTIWKHVVEFKSGVQRITLPQYSNIISVIEENGSFWIYYVTDPSETGTQIYNFYIMGTGLGFKDYGLAGIERFMGTFKVGSYVWHIFID